MLHQNQEMYADNFNFEATVCIFARFFALLIEGMSDTICTTRGFCDITEGPSDPILDLVVRISVKV